MTDVKKILVECEAFLSGHFLLSSGKHSNGYVQCAKLMMYPKRAEKVLSDVAEKLKDLELDAVVGPAMGGIVVSYELARQIGCRSLFTERENDVMTLKRGFELSKGEKIVISEDVVTTGKSSLETIEALKEYGVTVLGIACIANRSGKKCLGEYPIFSAIDLDIYTYDTPCPLCEQDMPLVKPGSRKKF